MLMILCKQNKHAVRVINLKYIKLILAVVVVTNIGCLSIVVIKWNNSQTNESKTSQEKTIVKYHLTYRNQSWEMYSNVTVVTAYFDLGTFNKEGQPGLYHTRNLYYKWARIFQYLKNPMVIYTDSIYFKLHMMAVRKQSAKYTKIFLIDRSSSWAFQNINEIKKVFDAKTYPKIYPNTVVPGYACAQHAKFDAIERAAKLNVFRTKYYMWLDVGYFRTRKTLANFYLAKPIGFVESKIAMHMVHFVTSFELSPEEIMTKNLVWVAGGLFFGERQQAIKFAAQVRRAVEYFLSEGLTNTDQEIIYAMYTKEGRNAVKPEVELQTYTPPREEMWYYLGRRMIREIISRF